MKLNEMTAEQIQQAEPEIISELLDKALHLKKTIADLEDRAKALLAEGIDIPNYFLKEGSKNRKISDVPRAVQALLSAKDLHITPNDLLEICTIPHGKLITLLTEKNGFTEKEAKAEFTETVGDLLTESQNKPSLKRAT